MGRFCTKKKHKKKRNEKNENAFEQQEPDFHEVIGVETFQRNWSKENDEQWTY